MKLESYTKQLYIEEYQHQPDHAVHATQIVSMEKPSSAGLPLRKDNAQSTSRRKYIRSTKNKHSNVKSERTFEEREVTTRQRSQREERRQRRERQKKCIAALQFAFEIDLPLNFSITISWDALINAGERSEKHSLHLKSGKRDQFLRKELARLCRKHSHPLAAIWSRDIGKRFGEHIHILMYFPSYRLDELIMLISRITGSQSDFIKSVNSQSVVARSVCGGWQVNVKDPKSRKSDKESAISFAEYLLEQDNKHVEKPNLIGKQFGISEAIGAAAQKRYYSFRS